MKREKSLIRELIVEKHNLIRSVDLKKITEEEYNIEIKKIDEKIEQETQNRYNKLIEIQHQREIEKNNEIKKRMEELNKMVNDKKGQKKEKKKEQKKETRGKKPKDNSYAAIIESVLSKKSIKNIDSAAEEVNKIKPGRDLSKIKSQIKATIYHVKKKDMKRWKDFTWDEEKYLLTKNQ